MQNENGNWLVPNEVLLHIFKYVHDRSNILCTCKKFNELICSLERNKKQIKMNSDLLLSENFDSIKNSYRRFDKFNLDTCKVSQLKELWRLKAIFCKFGPEIKELNWESCKMTRTEIVSLLNFMPNLESLSAIAWKIEEECYEGPLTILKLDHLKNIKLTRFDKTTIEFFTACIQKNAIISLFLHGDPEEFLPCQQSIKKLNLHVESLNSSHLQVMDLTDLTLKIGRYRDSEHSSIIKEVVENQPLLKSLDIVHCEGCFDGDDEAFEAICNLRYLESVKMNIDDLSYAAFEQNCRKLKNIKFLEIESVCHNYGPIIAIIEELCQQKMHKLEHLKLYLIDIGVPLNRVKKMGENFKTLKSFDIRCDKPLPLDCYLTNFANLKILKIDYHYSKEFSIFCNNFDIKYPSLQELSLLGFCFGSDEFFSNETTLMNLTNVLTNLQKLEIDAIFPFSTEFVMKVIEKLKHIKSIKGWSLVQSGEKFQKFDYEKVEHLIKISQMLEEFSIELRLKVIDIDISRVKEYLSKEFHVQLTRVGNLFALRLEKIKRV